MSQWMLLIRRRFGEGESCPPLASERAKFIEGAFVYHVLVTGKLFNEVSNGEVRYFRKIFS